MRILFVSNFYPPFQPGWGYMQLCEEVAEGLAKRGHELAVLTSQHRDAPELARTYPVYRKLRLDPDWLNGRPAAWQFYIGRKRRERRSLEAFQLIAARLEPDAIVIWNAYGIPRQVLKAAEDRTGSRAVYYLANYLPEDPDEYNAYWQTEPRGVFGRIFKRVLAVAALRQLREEGKPIRLRYEHAACVSGYLRERLISKGLIPEASVVIHNGVDLNQFKPQREKLTGPGLKLLIAGRLVEEKGIHTVIEALGILKQQGKVNGLTLTLLGKGDETYIKRLRRLMLVYGLGDRVNFATPVARENMPEILDRHDVLILPSEYTEPLARSAQEAMAMGLLVIGTTTGGSGELLLERQNCLTIKPGDPESICRVIKPVIADPTSFKRIAANGQKTILESFNIQKQIEKIENYLSK